MVGVREISRTAAFTWSPGTSSPYLATGTKAGAVDEGFSNETQLELWDLELGNLSKGRELSPAVSIGTDSRFNDIAWTQSESANSKGIIAGALENGSLDLWDTGKLLNGESNAFLSRTSKHSGAIKSLQFNAFRSELLATVGAKGELFISDLNNVGSPFRIGNAVARADDFECLDWNKRTPHIMVTGSSGGTMTVWDVKNKRESLTLNNLGRKAVSAVAWDPVKTTRLITAIPNDTDPVILVWDLRNANAPERILKGHDGGVLSLSWCQQDSDLLLSCGKDNRNICWNPQTGDSYGELPVVTNWTFQTRWNPRNPNFMATASFDGRVTVHSIQNTKSEVDGQAGNQSQPIDDEDFFNKAQSQPQGTAFTLSKAPKWLQRPCGATFGFGGKVVSFKTSASETNKRSMVRITSYAIDEGIVSSTDSFEEALNKNDLSSICETRIAEATDEADKSDWKVIKTLTSHDTRKDLVAFLGFSALHDEGADGISKLSINGSTDNEADSTLKSRAESPSLGKNRLSAFFDNNADGDNFLSELAATKGARTNNPFEMYTGSESESERRITRALLLGDFEKALEVCLQERRMSDAFMIAICGGQSCIDKAQKAYFNQKEGGPNYLRLLASVVGKNLWDLVHNADLASWKDVMAALCTYAEAKEFPDLCEALGDRLEETLGKLGAEQESRKDAAFCYLAGSKLEKVVAIWISELQEKEGASLKNVSKGSEFSIHARSLQRFIEKVTVFRQVSQYRDDQLEAASDWKLAPLYQKYIEYADIATAHGQLQIAERYLDLLPNRYAAADVAKSRIKNATRKVTISKDQAQQPAPAGRANQRIAQVAPDLQPEPNRQTRQAPGTAKAYAPTPMSQSQNPYAPANTQFGTQPYGNASYQQSQQPPPQPGLAHNLQYHTGPAVGPPRNFNASPSIPPPSKASNMGNWNDMPESFFKPPSTSRRGTPGVASNGPAQYQQSLPAAGQYTGAPQPTRSTPPIGPPPKAGGVPARVASPSKNAPPQPHGNPERPSFGNNPYAPAQSSLPVQSQATIPRGPSPYNAPPSAPPPSSRYAPSQPVPTTQNEASTTVGSGRQAPPPANPYAPQQGSNAMRQAQQAPSTTTGPPPRSAATPSQGPPERRPTTPKHRKLMSPSRKSKVLAN